MVDGVRYSIHIYLHSPTNDATMKMSLTSRVPWPEAKHDVDLPDLLKALGQEKQFEELTKLADDWQLANSVQIQEYEADQ